MNAALDLDKEEQNFLLGLARRAVEKKLKTGKTLRAKVSDEKLREKKGAFVTIKVKGQLRGCIGYVQPHKQLFETIIEMAIAAATQDFRFSPLTLQDLPDTKFEISVLSLPEPVADPNDIEIGKHGIIISKGFNKGLLLPQVPEEYGWDRETFLQHGCLKAGLDPDEWKKGALIEAFTAQVFAE